MGKLSVLLVAALALQASGNAEDDLRKAILRKMQDQKGFSGIQADSKARQLDTHDGDVGYGMEGDQIGAAHFVKDTNKANLMSLMGKDAKVYSLGWDLRPTDPAFGSRQCAMFTPDTPAAGGACLNDPCSNPPGAYGNVSSFDDMYSICGNGIGSQLDGLAHIGWRNVHYGGFKHEEMIVKGTVENKGFEGNGPGKHVFSPYYDHLPKELQYNYVQYNGIENVPPIVTRGIILDAVGLPSLADHLEETNGIKHLKGGTGITEAHTKEMLARQGLEVQPGDAVIYHTGWKALFRNDDAAFLSSGPGPVLSAAKFLVSKKVFAVGSDWWATECLDLRGANSPGNTCDPPGTMPEAVGEEGPEGSPFHIHVYLIAKHGTFILESLNTDAAMADGVQEGLFMLGQLKMQGGVQSLINPIFSGCPGIKKSGCYSIAEVAVSAGIFNSLVAAVTKAGLIDVGTGDNKATGGVTLMAPTDAAFEAAFKALGVTAEQALELPNLADILKYHVVAGTVTSKDLSDGMKVTTVMGEDFTVNVGEKGATITGSDLLPAANIVAADIYTNNGVIHIIDQVLIPPTNKEVILETVEALKAMAPSPADAAPSPGPAAPTTTAAPDAGAGKSVDAAVRAQQAPAGLSLLGAAVAAALLGALKH